MLDTFVLNSLINNILILFIPFLKSTYKAFLIHLCNVVHEFQKFGRGLYACARTFKSYEKNDLPGMTAKEMNICDEYEDGDTWCTHPAFEGICICHAINNLTDINLFSYPDVLRMNDFWCEIKVTHQLLTDLKGRRYSCILNKNDG